jgi:hypothetical protein
VKIASDDNNSHSIFSISWKMVKLFIASMKKVQNELSVKLRKIVAMKRVKRDDDEKKESGKNEMISYFTLSAG